MSISVVVPTRDRPELLAETLATVHAQRGVDIEIVVVDDGSVTPVAGALRSERPLGPGGARNLGLQAASGDWVAFLDDDDLWAPEKLRRQLDAAREAHADFAYSSAVVVDEALRPQFSAPAPATDVLRIGLLRRNVIPAGASNVIARRDLLMELGGFDRSLSHLDDWDLWLRLAQAASPAVDPEVTVAYRRHAGSRLLDDTVLAQRELASLQQRHSALTPDRAHYARWIAQAHVRAGRRGAAIRAYASGFDARTSLERLRSARRPPDPPWLIELRAAH